MSMTITGFEDLEKMFMELSEPRKVCEEAVRKAAPRLESSYKGALGSVIKGVDKNGRPYSKGNLLNSIHTMDVKNNDLGTYTVVGPTGSYGGVSNSQKAYWLEHGRGVKKGSNTAVRGSKSGHGYQNARPFLQKAVNDAESAVLSIMQSVIDDKIK